jgi:hypothetical protein
VKPFFVSIGIEKVALSGRDFQVNSPVQSLKGQTDPDEISAKGNLKPKFSP